jgi:hypothetical protein
MHPALTLARELIHWVALNAGQVGWVVRVGGHARRGRWIVGRREVAANQVATHEFVHVFQAIAVLV